MKKGQKTPPENSGDVPGKNHRILESQPNNNHQPGLNIYPNGNGHLPEDLDGIPKELLQFEIQNLRKAIYHYHDRFDYTPVRSLTIDGVGLIYEANLTFCQFVNCDRRTLNESLLQRFITTEQTETFITFL